MMKDHLSRDPAIPSRTEKRLYYGSAYAAHASESQFFVTAPTNFSDREVQEQLRGRLPPLSGLDGLTEIYFAHHGMEELRKGFRAPSGFDGYVHLFYLGYVNAGILDTLRKYTPFEIIDLSKHQQKKK